MAAPMVKTRWRANPRFRASISELIEKGPAEVRPATTEALRQNGEEVVPVMKRAAPVDDGNLQQSINWKFGPPPKGTLGITEDRTPNIPDDLRISIFAGGKSAPHAHLVHYGTGPRQQADGSSTGVMPPKPFFFPCIRAYRRRMRNRIVRAARKALKDALK
jgi:hypothetical protein